MNRLPHLAIACALVLFVGCNDDARRRPQPNRKPDRQAKGDAAFAVVTNITPGKVGGELDLPLVGEPRTFNPFTAHDRASEAITRRLFAGLTRFNWKTETPEPDLARSWSVADDGRTWTWQLRPNLKWSDGKALTADDVVFTWNDVIYSEHFINPLAATFSIDGARFIVSKVDESTVQFVTPKPFAPFVVFVGNVPVLPRHSRELRDSLKRRRFTEYLRLGTPAFRFVGSGPYRLKIYVPGEQVALERNEFYHRADTLGNRLPYFDLIRFRPLPAADDLPIRFANSNSLALAEALRFNDLPILKEASKTNSFQLLDLGPGAESRVLWFNQNANAAELAAHKRAWFREAAFRRAISLTIDREAIIRDVLNGNGALSRGFIITESRRWLTDDKTTFPHEPARAVDLLASLGIKKDNDGRLRDSEGRPVAFSIKLARGSATSTAVAQEICDQLNALGMRVTLEAVEFPALLHSVDAKFDYDAIIMGFGGGVPDPQSSGDILRSDGPLHFWNQDATAPGSPWEKQIDELFTRQRGESDFEQRRRTCDEIRTILARELPFIPLFVRHNHAALRGNLGNLKPVPNAPFPLTWNLEELFRR